MCIKWNQILIRGRNVRGKIAQVNTVYAQGRENLCVHLELFSANPQETISWHAPCGWWRVDVTITKWPGIPSSKRCCSPICSTADHSAAITLQSIRAKVALFELPISCTFVTLYCASYIQVDTIGFWRWCITHRDIGFSDFVHRPDFS
jgi:hypothetical protein